MITCGSLISLALKIDSNNNIFYKGIIFYNESMYLTNS